MPRSRSLSDLDTLKQFAQNLEEGLYVATADDRILDANPAFLELVGVQSVAELAAHPLTELCVNVSRRVLERTLLERDGKVRGFELQIRRPDGQLRTVLDTSYLVRDADNGAVLVHGVFVDVTARRQLEAELVELSTHDALTGALNRRFLDQLDEQFRRDPAGRWGCLFVDIDHFKHYNDEFGHQAGDRVLVRMARFLMRHVRAEEAVVRVGGDEFVVILVDADEAHVQGVANRLRESAERSAPVPFSLGWAAREPNEPLVRMLDRADRGLLAVRVVQRRSDPRGRLPLES
ncbi:MAG TPA: sensor domain-containing diguanylate cyclase [Gemmatimonadaceae bacterium]|jgi:diguanylate cyclase (GGDEF)-like protein/PAS domain S-box-containing protein|nr:sensor domain-containing diguanylate cyclase [Gemmatimonadaceae bacterium]